MTRTASPLPILPFLLLLLLLRAAPAQAGPILPDSLLAPALAGLGIRPDELRCFPEYNDGDPFRLPIVDSLMTRVSSADRLLPELLDELFAPPAERDPLGAPDLEWLLKVMPQLHPAAAAFDPPPWESERLRLLLDLGDEPALPERFFRVLLGDLCRQRSAALADLSAAERSHLIAESPLLMDETEDTDSMRDPIALRRLEQGSSAAIDSVLALWARVDRARLYAIGVRFLQQAAWYSRILYLERYRDAAPGLDSVDGPHVFSDGSRATGALHHFAETPYGNVAIGGDGANLYEGSFLYILDLGGDDHYRLSGHWPVATESLADSRRGFRVLHDLGGDDRYEALDDGALAGAFLGAALLVDESGDDIYQARSFDLGCGWLGTALLADFAGDDDYSGDRVVMGAGGCGVGALRDESGQDSYRAHLYAQGFAYCGGLGVLDDRAGGDLYAALPGYIDILRYEDHSLTLSQGFSIGARPNYSGGIGVLRDGGGNDSYTADIYGQGSAYWYALGLLYDAGGNDNYYAYQYAQGAGIHLAQGFLIDAAGNDSYSSHGVGQGCGHDLAFGLLRDMRGNDRYSCDDLSQGAGSANGIGVLLDDSGLDGYLSKGATAPAYGNPRRHFGSLGILVDGSGDDWFSRQGEPGETSGSLRGLLLDRDVPLGGAVWDPGEAVPYLPGDYDWEEYFLMAASGEPRFREWNRAGMDSLVANPDACIPVLVRYFDTDVARQRHSLKDVMRAIGAPAVDALREVLREGPASYRGVAAFCLENIGDARAFPELMGMLRAPRDFRDETNALAALSRIESLGAAQSAELAAACGELAGRRGTHELVLKEIGYLLGHQGIGDAALLVELASADHYAPRWTARAALQERENWGGAFAGAWESACASGEANTLLRLCDLLPLRPASEIRRLLRVARGSAAWDDGRVGSALLRALREHPQGDGLALRGLRDRLAREF